MGYLEFRLYSSRDFWPDGVAGKVGIRRFKQVQFTQTPACPPQLNPSTISSSDTDFPVNVSVEDTLL